MLQASHQELLEHEQDNPTAKMSDGALTDVPSDELSELDWLLRVDVRTTIEHLTQILNDCATSIISNTPTQYNLSYSSQNQVDTLKVSTTLEGYRITTADINIKLSSKHPMQTIKTCIKETSNNPFCWRLYQIQDAINHLNHSIDLLKDTPLRLERSAEDRLDDLDFEPADEVLQLVNNVMNSLQKSRSSLLVPKKSSVEELQNCQNTQSISPALPLDYTISFYIQSSNLVCSVYHLSQSNNRAQVKNEYQAEVAIPFLSDVLVLQGLGLQVCQQLKDKIQTLQDAC